MPAYVIKSKPLQINVHFVCYQGQLYVHCWRCFAETDPKSRDWLRWTEHVFQTRLFQPVLKKFVELLSVEFQVFTGYLVVSSSRPFHRNLYSSHHCSHYENKIAFRYYFNFLFFFQDRHERWWLLIFQNFSAMESWRYNMVKAGDITKLRTYSLTL